MEGKNPKTQKVIENTIEELEETGQTRRDLNNEI